MVLASIAIFYDGDDVPPEYNYQPVPRPAISVRGVPLCHYPLPACKQNEPTQT